MTALEAREADRVMLKTFRSDPFEKKYFGRSGDLGALHKVMARLRRVGEWKKYVEARVPPEETMN